MAKKKKRKFKKFARPPHTYISKRMGRLTPTAKVLFDLIFYFGLGGLYMSNETIARHLNCATRSVRRARRQLEERNLIVSARSNPYTVTSWNRYHPAVRDCEWLLYPKNQRLENPFYQPYSDKNFWKEKDSTPKVQYKAPKTIHNQEDKNGKNGRTNCPPNNT